jgi:hypothetical protein
VIDVVPFILGDDLGRKVVVEGRHDLPPILPLATFLEAERATFFGELGGNPADLLVPSTT